MTKYIDLFQLFNLPQIREINSCSSYGALDLFWLMHCLGFVFVSALKKYSSVTLHSCDTSIRFCKNTTMNKDISVSCIVYNSVKKKLTTMLVLATLNSN